MTLPDEVRQPEKGVRCDDLINGPAPLARPGPDIREVSPECTARLTLAAAARLLREAVKDKSYRAFPLGQDAGAYLRQNRGRLLPNTYKTYESCLDKLARYFADLELRDFEPPLGTERLEEFIDENWGERASRTRAKNISIVKGFFEWAVLSGRLYGDPARPIRPPKKRGVHRETFSGDHRVLILASGPDPDSLHRDRCALRLLLVYALRKESLRRVQFRHFDHERRRLTIFTKGSKVRTIPIVEAAFWNDLGRHIIEWGAEPDDYLLCRRDLRPNRHKPGEKFITEYRDQPMGVHGLHKWWYRCLQRAGIVAEGITHGRKMHMARHTAGQFGARPHRQPKGRPEAAGSLVDHHDRRHLHRLGYRPARGDDAHRGR